MERGPNKAQMWSCSQCRKVTAHSIQDSVSDWENLGPELEGFVRCRRCTQCQTPLRTVEVKEEELGRLQSELAILRKAKNQLDQLHSALRELSFAERRVQALVNSAAVGILGSGSHPSTVEVDPEE